MKATSVSVRLRIFLFAFKIPNSDRINRRGTERAVHENLRRVEYDAAHGPPGLMQFSSHLRQVVWPRNFKLEKLKKYDGKENPKNWITPYEIVDRSAAGDEHVMANYFPVVLDQAGYQWLLGLRTPSILGRNCARRSSTISLPPASNLETNMISKG